MVVVEHRTAKTLLDLIPGLTDRGTLVDKRFDRHYIRSSAENHLRSDADVDCMRLTLTGAQRLGSYADPDRQWFDREMKELDFA
jgi:hypothetical protein